jgi:hypothetical protein
MTAPIRKPSTALQWHPHSAATESTIIDMANSRQIALRIRLRHHYWMTECKPISPVTVTLVRKKMVMIDTKDKMTEADVTELLTDHYGFIATPEGLTIPDLDEARGSAIGATEARAERAGAGGRAKAERAKVDVLKTQPISLAPVATVIDNNPADF